MSSQRFRNQESLFGADIAASSLPPAESGDPDCPSRFLHACVRAPSMDVVGQETPGGGREAPASHDRGGPDLEHDLLGTSRCGQDHPCAGHRAPDELGVHRLLGCDQRHQGDSQGHGGAEACRQLGRRTILFVDEIHRFNKAQQDAFLPYVERGSIVLIGATTENPSFEINGALLSRCRVFVLHELGEDDLVRLMRHALLDPRGFGGEDVRIADEQLSAIAPSPTGTPVVHSRRSRWWSSTARPTQTGPSPSRPPRSSSASLARRCSMTSMARSTTT